MSTEHITFYLHFAAIALAFVIVIGGLSSLYFTLRRQNQGFGDNTTKLIAIVVFVPVVLVISVTKAFAPEAITALLGTIAGYIFSQPGDSNNESLKDQTKKPD